jgi:hypothetical protein
MQKHETNIYKPGRRTNYIIPDVMGKGMHIMMTSKPSTINDLNKGDYVEGADRMDAEEDWGFPDELEVEDDGSLDV